MLEMSHELLDLLREEYPGAFKGWDQSRVRITADEVANDGPDIGRILCLVILFNLHGEKQKKPQKHNNKNDRPEGKKMYKMHKVLLTDVRTEETKVGGEELISEFYTLVDGDNL